MNDYGTITEAGSVRFERRLPGPIDRVWAYLTDPDKRATWLAGGPMDLRVGGAVRLDFRHAYLSAIAELPPEKYADMCDGTSLPGRITAYDPPNVLAYTWGEPEGGSPGGIPSEVTFELTANDDEVLLVLTHRQIGERPVMVSVSSGWHAHLAILMDALQGRERRPFWSTHSALEADYDTRVPAA
jgi:uncharacterized protein YndB with AHSA1/START domain